VKPTTTEIEIPAPGALLAGMLTIPDGAQAIVLFAHGSGSSRHSPRNARVARELHERGLGTLLFDLLTADEEQEDLMTREFRFDIPLLGDRLAATIEWLGGHSDPRRTLGLFGASTGAAAALVAAARLPSRVAAVVSRGGRPDLAGGALTRVRAATLLIVGGDDNVVLELNERALDELRCVKQLAVIPGATHLFEEPGALEQVAQLAAEWFVRHCTR
jgi:dienelactone hydrolase